MAASVALYSATYLAALSKAWRRRVARLPWASLAALARAAERAPWVLVFFWTDSGILRADFFAYKSERETNGQALYNQ